MRTKSPLSDLCDVLGQVREAAADSHRSTLTKNEATTRAVLIDPVLRALGWDAANTYMMEMERTFGATRIDYALYDFSQDVRIIIEAKPLGKNLLEPGIILDLVKYAFTYGLQDIFLTDGLIWHHFTNFQPGNTAATRVIDLVKDDLVESAAYLVQRLDAAKFWPQEQTFATVAQQVAQLESAVASLQQEMEKLKTALATPHDALQPPVISPTSTSDNTVQLTSDQSRFTLLQDLGFVTSKKPIAIRLPDGTMLPIRTWKDVLREYCKYSLTHSQSIPVPLPDRAGRKVKLFTFDPIAKGLSHVSEVYQGKPIYIYLNYDANDCVANSLHVLKQVPATASLVSAAVRLAEPD